MKSYPLMLILVMIFGIGAQTDCEGKPAKQNQPQNMENKNVAPNSPLKIPTGESPEKPGGEIKILSEGSNIKVETPFVFVARTGETYAGLRNLVGGLPPASDFDFNKEAVVAVFAGQKNTGGYAVEISGERGKASAKLISPPPDAIVPEVLTTPFQVVSMPVGEENGVQIELGENWTSAIRSYRVKSGEFEYSGGFVGRRVTFEPKGTIGVLAAGELVSLIFDLEGLENNNPRKLTEIASGTLKDEKASLARLEAAGFIESPHPPLVISGTISWEKLSLKFEPGKRAYIVNDGYEGSGTLVADLVR